MVLFPSDNLSVLSEIGVSEVGGRRKTYVDFVDFTLINSLCKAVNRLMKYEYRGGVPRPIHKGREKYVVLY